MTRWPYVGWGCIAAVMQKIHPRQVTFKITPKGEHNVTMLPARLVMPYAVIAAFTFSAGLYGARAGHPLGYVGLSLLTGLNYLLVLLCVCLMHAVETRRVTNASARNIVATVARPLLIAVPLTALGAFAVVATWTFVRGAHTHIVDNIVDLLKPVQVW